MTTLEDISIRAASIADIPAIIDLYQGTVRSVNARDYSPWHVEVWASGASGHRRWKMAIAEQYFVIAEVGGAAAGFGSIAKDGYLDFLYVHKDFQRRGFGSALLISLEQKACEQKNQIIYSHVSRTTKGIFERFGYSHEGDQEDLYQGVLFVNAVMVKRCES